MLGVAILNIPPWGVDTRDVHAESRLVGVRRGCLARLCRRYLDHRDEITTALAAGEASRRAYLPSREMRSAVGFGGKSRSRCETPVWPNPWRTPEFGSRLRTRGPRAPSTRRSERCPQPRRRTRSPVPHAPSTRVRAFCVAVDERSGRCRSRGAFCRRSRERRGRGSADMAPVRRSPASVRHERTRVPGEGDHSVPATPMRLPPGSVKCPTTRVPGLPSGPIRRFPPRRSASWSAASTLGTCT